MNLTGLPPRQKRQQFVSPALRASAKGQPCALRLSCCNHDPETTVLAHLRLFGMAGIGEKPDDWCAVFACSACHDAIDRRGGATEGLWGYEDLLRAMIETLRIQFAEGRLVAK